jgi:hypothetical protein
MAAAAGDRGALAGAAQDPQGARAASLTVARAHASPASRVNSARQSLGYPEEGLARREAP